MTLERQAMGKSGEDLAVTELERRGYAILARRYRTDRGEIDIVAEDGDTLVFVEVKARASAEFGTAAEAVTRRKQLQVIAMARTYCVLERVEDVPCRFDVVAVDGVGDGAIVTVYPGAFEVA
jgi:putative endonuclease